MSPTTWNRDDRRSVLMLTHGFPLIALSIGEAVALLILWAGDPRAAGVVSTAAMAMTGLLARQGRLAAPAAVAGVGIVARSPGSPAQTIESPDTDADAA